MSEKKIVFSSGFSGLFSIKFLGLWVFFLLFFPCASLNSYGKPHGRFPWISRPLPFPHVDRLWKNEHDFAPVCGSISEENENKDLVYLRPQLSTWEAKVEFFKGFRTV